MEEFLNYHPNAIFTLIDVRRLSGEVTTIRGQVAKVLQSGQRLLCVSRQVKGSFSKGTIGGHNLTKPPGNASVMFAGSDVKVVAAACKLVCCRSV
jgi:hypothetical protein